MKTLQEIESSYDFSEVTYKGLSVWMLLRLLIHAKIIERDSNGYSLSFRTKSILNLIKNGITGISKLFKLKSFDYWFFTNSDKRNWVEGKYKENYFDDLADKLGQDKSLFVEYTIDILKPRRLIYSKSVSSDLIFKLLASFISKFVQMKDVRNLNLIENVIKEERLHLDLEKALKRNIAEYKLYKFIFNHCMPKAIFVICYYSKIPLIAAAHDCGIKVIEYQHGVITDKNEEYNSQLKNEKRYFPDFLLSFGKNLITSNYDHFIYGKENIIPLGSSYMESIKNNYVDDYLDRLKRKHSKIVCVTSSGIFLDKLMLFVRHLSSKNKNYLFIIRIKHREDVSQYLSDNIILLPQYNIYHILKYSDYNITIGSFVAYEADFYGVNNILLNVNNISRKYINADVHGVFVEEEDMLNFNFADNPMKFEPSDAYFVGFDTRIDRVCSLLKEKF